VYDYILRNPNIGSENNIWVISSFNSFLEALSLMDLYKISFEEVKQQMRKLIKPY
jgi:hypothetical protein